MEALNILGFKTYHTLELFANGDASAWKEWLETGNFGPVADILASGGYNATTDEPACIAYKELMERVVLTYREDLERWGKSISIIAQNGYILGGRIQRYLPGVNAYIELFEHYWKERRDCTAPITEESLPRCVANYHKHIEEVKRVVPAERLLVYKVTEGWGPLCAFLGVPVPDVPFPRSNSSEDMMSGQRFLIFVAVVINLVALCLAIALVIACVRIVRALKAWLTQSEQPKSGKAKKGD
jgi:hypothetical protein